MTSIAQSTIGTEQPRRRAGSEVQADQPTVVLRLPNLNAKQQAPIDSELPAPPLAIAKSEPSADYLASIGEYWVNVRSWLDTHPVRQGALLSWIWRGGVALVAVVLVGLAYYIINNPAAGPGDANGDAGPQATASSEVQLDDDSSANWTIDTQRLEPQPPDAAVDTWHAHSPAESKQLPYHTGEINSDHEVSSGMEKVPPRFALPTNPPTSSSDSNPSNGSNDEGLSRRPWNTDETRTHDRADEAGQRASWKPPSSSITSGDALPHRETTSFGGGEQLPDAVPPADSPTSPSIATQYDYPTTDPATWRYASQAGEGASLESPDQQSWPPVSSRHNGRESVRPPVARLHGDIERTPVRR